MTDPRFQVFGEDAPAKAATVVAMGPGGLGANWWSRIAPDLGGVRILAVRIPGRETRLSETPLTTLAEMADDIAGWAAGEEPDLAALVGVCSGCAVVTELASRLNTDAALILVNPPAIPTPPNPYLSLSSADLATQLLADGTISPPIAASAKLFRLFEPAIRADFTAVEHYQPRRDDRRRNRFAIVTSDVDGGDAASWGVPPGAITRVPATSEELTAAPRCIASALIATLALANPAHRSR